jgi:hypothetical protein
MSRQGIFDAINDERAYQDKKWGGAAHDDNQETEADFVRYIGEYSAGAGRSANYDFRTRMVKTAALAVAAIERHDRLAVKA